MAKVKKIKSVIVRENEYLNELFTYYGNKTKLLITLGIPIVVRKVKKK